MEETSGEKRGIAELLEKIPPEKRWEITAKTLWRLMVLRGVRTMPTVMGKAEGIISPVRGWEQWQEIATKIMIDGAKKMYPWIKELFNIPVEDAIGAAKLTMVYGYMLGGPEQKQQLVEATREKAVARTTKCTCWERYEEFEVDLDLRAGCNSHQASSKESLKTVNPKLIYKLKKAMGWGDPYCESVIEFKEE